MKQGILVASFGTAVQETRERTIGAIEEEAARRWPEAFTGRAFTSEMIRRKLARTGVEVDDVPAAIRRMEEAGVTHLAVLSTYIMGGVEYHRLLEGCERAAGRFQELRVAPPLLDSAGDLQKAAQGMLSLHPGLTEDTALVLMGHGTAHPGDFAYAALEYAFRDLGRRNVLVATVEGWPDFDCLLRRLGELGARKVILRPFMTTAGEHVREDMAGSGPDSWRNRLEKQGYQVDCVLEGLGELAPFREMFLEHLAGILENTPSRD